MRPAGLRSVEAGKASGLQGRRGRPRRPDDLATALTVHEGGDRGPRRRPVSSRRFAHWVGKQLRAPLDYSHSARRGTYRVIYRIDGHAHTVSVVDVQHRRDAYRSHH